MTVHQPTIKQLQYLVALRQHGHFGKAADACYVSQSTLSAGLRELETLLGVILVERTRRWLQDNGVPLSIELIKGEYRLKAAGPLALIIQAQTAAAVLGHNFPDSRWYKDAYNLVKSGGLEPSENQGSWISRTFKKMGLG